jgi:hypothetical protein
MGLLLVELVFKLKIIFIYWRAAFVKAIAICNVVN